MSPKRPNLPDFNQTAKMVLDEALAKVEAKPAPKPKAPRKKKSSK